MRFEQEVGRDRSLHLFGGDFREPRLWMLAGVGVRPAVEAALLNADQIIGDEIIAETVAFLNERVEVPRVRMERQSGWIPRSRREGRLVPAVLVEALDRRFRLRFDPEVSG